MTSATFNPDTRKIAVTATVVIISTILLTVLFVTVFLSVYNQTPESSVNDPTQHQLDFVSGSFDETNNGAGWTSFFRRKSVLQDKGRLADSYRLAGTYFEFGAAADKRRAIVDEIATKSQHVISEGQTLNDLLVLAIENDNILIRTPAGQEERLWLSFRHDEGLSGDQSPSGKTASGQAEGAVDQFGGKRVGENRWVFEREKLTDYYKELMSEPERLVKVFDSLKPLYDDNGKIEGYELEIFGEEQFFNSTGLQAGDVVRSVNSIKMTNRRRAEYLISEFVNDRINVIVMDIEREGNPSKFIYQIR